MTSFQISITPSRRAAARFVTAVRRALQKALAEEHGKSGLSQSELARQIGVNRSVISRELNGYNDLTLGRVAELAHAMGRIPEFSLPTIDDVTIRPSGTNGSSSMEAEPPSIQSYAVQGEGGDVRNSVKVDRQAA